MIIITRDGANVIVSISAHVNTIGPKSFVSSNGRHSEVDAALLVDKLDATLRASIEECRRAEYDRGWKDAKSKRATKRMWFRPFISGDAP